METVICIFGDSITWGAFLSFRGAWANLLRNYFEDFKMIAIYDLGIDTNTSRDVLERFEPEAKARKPNIIIFAVGINDSAYRKTKDNPLISIDEFRDNLIKLVNKARKFTDKIFFVGLAKGDDSNTIPLTRSTTGKCYDKENTKKYNNIIKSVCEEENIKFIDIISTLSDEDFDDGLHPNLGGHQKIFEIVKDFIIKNKII
jgi:lysophospholipase L1-like esterase